MRGAVGSDRVDPPVRVSLLIGPYSVSTGGLYGFFVVCGSIRSGGSRSSRTTIDPLQCVTHFLEVALDDVGLTPRELRLVERLSGAAD